MKTSSPFVRLTRTAIGLFAALACVSPLLAQRGNPNVALDGKSPDQLIAEFMAANKVPGLSVAIVQAPYITRITGYGLSDTGRKLLVSSNTLFPIGRMAEAYTAVGVLQLVEQGKVKLDDPIESYVSMAPQAWHGVTVRQLIQHQTGLPDYTKVTPRNPTDPPAELFKAVSETGPTFEPGTKTEPSASNYFLLQLLIENVSGQSYEGFIRANQFDKLGLQHTFFSAELAGISRELPSATERHQQFLHDPKFINPTEPATGYEGAEATPITAPDALSLPVRAVIYASAEDISIWDLGLAGDILLKDPELRKVLYTPAKLKDGSFVPSSGPWTFTDHPGLMIATGSSPGFSTLLARYTDPKDLLCVTLLANKDGLDLTILAAQIAGAYDPALKPKPTPTPAPVATPAPAASASPSPSPTAAKKS